MQSFPDQGQYSITTELHNNIPASVQLILPPTVPILVPLGPQSLVPSATNPRCHHHPHRYSNNNNNNKRGLRSLEGSTLHVYLYHTAGNFVQEKIFSYVKDCIADTVWHIGERLIPQKLLQYKNSWAWWKLFPTKTFGSMVHLLYSIAEQLHVLCTRTHELHTKKCNNPNQHPLSGKLPQGCLHYNIMGVLKRKGLTQTGNCGLAWTQPHSTLVGLLHVTIEKGILGVGIIICITIATWKQRQWGRKKGLLREWGNSFL